MWVRCSMASGLSPLLTHILVSREVQPQQTRPHRSRKWGMVKTFSWLPCCSRQCLQKLSCPCWHRQGS